MKNLLLALLFLPQVTPASEVTMRPVRENIDEEFSEFRSFVDKLGSEGPQRSPRCTLMARANANVPGNLSSFWKEGTENPYKKNVALDTISDIGKTAAAAVGTIQQMAAAAMLNQRANELQGTGDPQFQQAASIYREEASAISNGDSAGANAAASKLDGISRSDTSGYSPTSSDLSYKQRANKVAGKVIGTIAGVAVAAVMSYFGGAAYAPMVGAAAGGLVEYGVDSVDKTGEDGEDERLASNLEDQLGRAGDQVSKDVSTKIEQKMTKDPAGAMGKDKNADQKAKQDEQLNDFGIKSPFTNKNPYDTGGSNVDGKVLK